MGRPLVQRAGRRRYRPGERREPDRLHVGPARRGLGERCRSQVEDTPDSIRRGERTVELRPARAREQIGGRANTGEDSGRQHLGACGRMLEQRRAAGPDHAVGQREQSLVDPAGVGIETVDGERPTVSRDDARQIGSAPYLLLQHLHECARASPDVHDSVGHTVRLDPYRADHGRAGFGDQHERVAPRKPADLPEFVTRDQHRFRIDAVGAELVEHPACRIGFVGESDLDVFGVAGRPRIVEAGLPRGRSGDLRDLGQAPQTGTRQSIFDRGEQPIELCLRRIRPLGQRDEIDLPSVQAGRDDARLEPAFGEPRHGEIGGARQRGVFGRCRGAPSDDARTVGEDFEELRTALERHQQTTGPCRSRPELAIDVSDVRAAHDGDVDTART